MIWLWLAIFCCNAQPLSVEDNVGREVAYVQIFLDGTLLSGREVVMDEVLTCEIVLCNRAAPGLCLAAIAQIQVSDRQVAEGLMQRVGVVL